MRKKASVVRPPAPAVCAMFSSQHSLCSNDPQKCSRCRGSTTKAKKTAWLSSPCFDLQNVNGTVFDLPPGRRVHIGGGFAHISHKLRYHAGLGVWFCTACGYYAAQQLVNLAQKCPDKIEGNRTDYLDRISRNLWPKVYSKAERAKRVK